MTDLFRLLMTDPAVTDVDVRLRRRPGFLLNVHKISADEYGWAVREDGTTALRPQRRGFPVPAAAFADAWDTTATDAFWQGDWDRKPRGW